MSPPAARTWIDANQHFLSASLAVVRLALEQYVAGLRGATGGTAGGEKGGAPVAQSGPMGNAPFEAVSSPPAIQTLCRAFGLSDFERDVLLMCAGIELEASFASLCAEAHGDPRRPYPTFSLALAVLPGAHWTALTPASPLRRWRFVEVGAGDALTTSALRIDERILHYLTGVAYIDERLRGLAQPVPATTDLPPSHRALAGRIAQLWSRSAAGVPPLIQMCGSEHAGKRAIAASACAALGLELHAIRAHDLPGAAAEREALGRLWEREAVLSGVALLIDCDDADGPDGSAAALAFVDSMRAMLFVASRDPLRIRTRLFIRLDVAKPTADEQQVLWHRALGPSAQALNGQLQDVVAQFNLGIHGIYAVSAGILTPSVPGEGGPAAVPDVLRGALWEACRAQARPRLDDLAQRIDPAATWDDLVLPGPQRQLLRDIAGHLRRRSLVYDTWGFSAKGARGLGISALFTGASGTGKTMAAEVLAQELRLDLYRIDLSQVVSKYIGETEKNLRRVFDAAEEGGAILLFDEADALFGKRSEVKDSHDRYANIEISYLLQRMEAYRGLAVLTTNMKNALDTTFMRRIRFIVQFPFPDAIQRAEIWRRIFPASTPTDNLDAEKLARLNVAGGNIRNIALHAAFLAADNGEPVRMAHLLRAARSEYAKLEQPLTETEIGGWA